MVAILWIIWVVAAEVGQYRTAGMVAAAVDIVEHPQPPLVIRNRGQSCASVSSIIAVQTLIPLRDDCSFVNQGWVMYPDPLTNLRLKVLYTMVQGLLW